MQSNRSMKKRFCDHYGGRPFFGWIWALEIIFGHFFLSIFQKLKIECQKVPYLHKCHTLQGGCAPLHDPRSQIGSSCLKIRFMQWKFEFWAARGEKREGGVQKLIINHNYTYHIHNLMTLAWN